MEGQNVVIIGGGLVGALCATFMAKRGCRVTVYEGRQDIRLASFVQGRSINLSLSNRGRRSLRAVGLEEIVLKDAIPMRGRMLHGLQGDTKSVLYDAGTNQCIYSVSRNYLNQVLLTAAESYSNVKFYFEHKLLSANIETGNVTILNKQTKESKTVAADLIIGADGAFSTLRRFMQQTPLFQFSQSYIEHGYLELSIPPERGHKMTPNHLHIWPRGDFMMIALPNKDDSWTVTLFMPFERFRSLENEDHLKEFFSTTFPDALPLIGENRLVKDFFKTKPSPLVSIKCSPYHVNGKFLIVGDAAHAMVPFYGQGMNAGFEDCFILNQILTLNEGQIGRSIAEYSNQRAKDAFAICELAMYNYTEMRDLVNRTSYHVRKTLDDFLYKLFPSQWVPLYNSVTFSKMGYKECIQNRKWQNTVIHRIVWSLAILFCVTSSFYLFVK